MLVLTRRSRESLKVGDNVKITILGIRGNTVRIGVLAPESVPVHREEVYERIKAELGERWQWGLEEVDAPTPTLK